MAKANIISTAIGIKPPTPLKNRFVNSVKFIIPAFRYMIPATRIAVSTAQSTDVEPEPSVR